MNKFDDCFGEIEISTENQVLNITETKENKRKNCPYGEEEGFPKKGIPEGKHGREKALDFREKSTKKGLTGGAKRGKISPH